MACSSIMNENLGIVLAQPEIIDCGKRGFFRKLGLRRIQILQEGSSATVYLAKQYPFNANGQKRAVKVFSRRGSQGRKFKMDYFRREISLMNSLDHPNIMTKVKAGVCPFYYAISMRYCPKGDLLELTERAAIPLSTMERYTAQLVSAVRYLHSVRVYHGDIKPENILLDDNEKDILLTDFGHAQILPPARNTIMHVGGTDLYLAPEVVLPDNPNAFKLEAYAVGVTILQLLMREDLQKCDCQHFALKLQQPPLNTSSFAHFLPNLLLEDPGSRWSVTTLYQYFQSVDSMMKLLNDLKV